MSLFNTVSSLSALCVLGALPLKAQPMQGNDIIEELIVTGSREPIATGDLGASFSILDSDAIEARQVPVLSSLLRDLPGLAVSQTGPVGSQTQIRIRGAEGNQTLVLIDGIEATDPVGNFEFDFADLLSTGVERIEVIRGPQSALYGSEAIGGVINIRTRRPEPGLKLEALGEGGSFGTARVGGTLSGGTEAIGGTLSVGYMDTSGVSASPTGPEDDGYENLTLSGKIIARPADHIELGVIGRYVSAESEFDAQNFATGQVIDADELRKFDAFYGRVYGRIDLFEGAWRHSVSGELTDTDSDNFNADAFVNSFEGQRAKVEYQTTVRLDIMQITGAVEHEEMDFTAIGPTPDDPVNQDKSDDQTSFVGEWRASPLDGVTVSASVRHDINDTFADETTWRTGLSWQVMESTRLHSGAGTGVSDPTFFDRFGFFPGQFMGNPDLIPEQAFGWDIGIEQSFWDGRGLVDATFFASELEDEITQTFDFATFISTAVNQPGKSERRGVELSGRVLPLPGLRLDAAYTYLDADEPDGSREIRRAKHIASVSVDYRFLDDTAGVNLDFDYNGEQDDLDFSTFPAARVSLDSFLLVTLAARYEIIEGLEAFARVENLLDENYRNVLGFNTPGIGAFAGLRARY